MYVVNKFEVVNHSPDFVGVAVGDIEEIELGRPGNPARVLAIHTMIETRTIFPCKGTLLTFLPVAVVALLPFNPDPAAALSCWVWELNALIVCGKETLTSTEPVGFLIHSISASVTAEVRHPRQFRKSPLVASTFRVKSSTALVSTLTVNSSFRPWEPEAEAEAEAEAIRASIISLISTAPYALNGKTLGW